MEEIAENMGVLIEIDPVIIKVEVWYDPDVSVSEGELREIVKRGKDRIRSELMAAIENSNGVTPIEQRQ
jgi:hypothetical protein